LPCDSVERFTVRPRVTVPSVIALHDEGPPASDSELIHAADHPPHSVWGQRPHRVHTVFSLQLLLRSKNRIAWLAPVDDLRRALPGQQLPGPNLRAVPRPMRPLRPDNGPSVTSCHQYKAFPRG